MNSRFLLIILSVLFVFSCNHFVNLGDKSADGADYTEGLPDEISEEGRNSDSVDSDYNDWNEDSADSLYDDGGDSMEDSGSEESEPDTTDTCETSDTDTETDSGTVDSDADADTDYDNNDPEDMNGAPPYECRFPDCYPFYGNFSNADCDCGYEPEYEPVCCNGIISVFNSCFANCYAINSSNKICTVYKPGLCAAKENSGDDSEEIPETDIEENDDQDAEIVDDIDDADAEMPDSDEEGEVSVNECGCYPGNKPSIFSCGETYYFITECLANCHCENPQKLFF